MSKYVVTQSNNGRCTTARLEGTETQVPLSELPAGWRDQLVTKNMMERGNRNSLFLVSDSPRESGNITWPNGWGP
jgi:hypothetical protein